LVIKDFVKRRWNLGRPTRRWEDNSKLDLKETRRECVDWVHVVQDTEQYRLV
jgi:hypothetical protein